jgi:hypothetical protein
MTQSFHGKKYFLTRKFTLLDIIIILKLRPRTLSREILYSILREFGISRKIERLIKMCLNEIYSRARIGKISPTSFLFRMA